MNIFKLSDKEFEKYLNKNIDTLNPKKLLADLTECGLESENDLNDVNKCNG